VRGASRLAAAAGISPLVIGLTVVAFGTSSPELAVSVRSGLLGTGGADIALGNVVGSNIFNILFILGISAVMAPLVVSQQLVRIDVPLMITVSILILLAGLDGVVGRLEGLLLFLGVIAYTAFAIHLGRKESRAVQEEYEREYSRPAHGRRAIAGSLVLAVAGLAMLVAGAHWLVKGAVQIARSLGISELVIGLTIVSVGTSLPEVATSVVAAVRGERDIAVGNVVGSNLFNLLSVLGLSAAISPQGINVPPAALRLDIPVMIAASALCLPIFFTGYRITRSEGALFLACYVLYVVYLILSATGHAALPGVGIVVGAVVVPATVLVLLVSVIRQVRRRSGKL
jgi:cation:H+ antiporter